MQKRYLLSCEQLLMAVHGHELARYGNQDLLPAAHYQAPELLTTAAIREILFVGREVPKRILDPEYKGTATVRVTRKMQEIVVAAVRQLVRWSAIRGSRVVTTTHSALWATLDDSGDQGKDAIKRPGPVFEATGCSRSAYKRALHLLLLLGYPGVACKRHNLDDKLTETDRCWTVILPALPSGANVDRSIDLPADALERCLEPGAQLQFASFLVDDTIKSARREARENQFDPPYSPVKAPVVNASALAKRPTSNVTTRHASLATSDSAATPGEQKTAAANFGGGFARFWRLWNERFPASGVLVRLHARLYDNQIAAVARLLETAGLLLDEDELWRQIEGWLDRLVQRKLARAPHPLWIHGFVRGVIAEQFDQSRTLVRVEARRRRKVLERLEMFAAALSSSPLMAPPQMFRAESDDEPPTLFLVVDSAWWQILAHKNQGAHLFLHAARSAGFARLVVRGPHGRLLAHRQIVQLARKAPLTGEIPVTGAAELVAPADDPQLRLRSARAIARALPRPLESWYFPVAHRGGACFTVDVGSLGRGAFFEERYYRVYERALSCEFVDELGGEAITLEIIATSGYATGWPPPLLDE